MKIEAQLDFKSYLKLIAYLTVKRPLMIILMVAIAFFLIKAFIYFIGYGNDFPFLGFTFSLCFIVIYPLLIFFSTKKNFSSNKRLQEKIEYEFTAEKIVIRGESFITEMDWTKMYKVVELKNWILIYQSAQTANIIPKKSFEGSLPDFKEIVESSGVKFKLKK